MYLSLSHIGRTSGRSGQLLLEVLIAVAVAAIIIPLSAQILFVSGEGGRILRERDTAMLLAEEALAAARAATYVSWNNLYLPPDGTGSATVSKGAANHYRVATTTGGWTLATGEETITVDDLAYTRYITIDNVSRTTPSRDIEAVYNAANDDSGTQKITAVVSWRNTSFSLSEYAYRYENKVCFQTVWSAQAQGPVVCPPTTYASIDGFVDLGTAGEVRMGPATTSPWTFAGDDFVRDETDIDFGGGTFASTTVVGTGLSATVTLATGAAAWSAVPSPTTQDLNALFVLSANDIWAAGKSGAIVHYTGGSWVLDTDTGTQEWYDIAITSASDGWVVGKVGAIYRWNGSVWTATTSPISVDINGMSALSATDIWAVGSSGKILHRTTGAWTQFVDTGGEVWNDVEMVSATDGWVVGNGGAIRRWNGTAWNVVTSPTTQDLLGISVISSSDVWAAGKSGAIIRWNGTAWSLHTDTGGQVWNDIDMRSASDGWVVAGSGLIYLYNGTTWSNVTSPTTQDLNAVVALGATDAWSVGKSGGSGTIIHFSGASYATSGVFTSRILDSGEVGGTNWNTVFWTEDFSPAGSDITIATRTGSSAVIDGTWSAWSAELSDSTSSNIPSPDGRRYIQYRATFTRGSDPTLTPSLDDVTLTFGTQISSNLFAIGIVSSNDIWVVGRSGTIIHWDGTGWTTVTSPTGQDLLGISVVSATDIWAVGRSGVILRWNGAAWSIFVDTGADVWNDVVMVSATDGWIVGNGGLIRRWNGSAWNTVVSPTAQDLNSISMLTSSDIWAAGKSGAIIRWNGSAWSLHTDTGTQVWNDIDMVSTSDGWVVAGGGSIYRYNGTTWSNVPSPTSQDLNAVAMVSATRGWGVGKSGGSGTIILWDGVSWQLAQSPTNQDLNDVAVAAPMDYWIVGDAGVILRLSVRSAVLLSPVIDLGVSGGAGLNSIGWQGSLPSGSFVRFQVAASASSTGPWNFIGGSTCLSTDYYTPAVDTAEEIGCYSVNTNKRYMRYRAELCSASSCADPGLDSPQLRDVMISWSP